MDPGIQKLVSTATSGLSVSVSISDHGSPLSLLGPIALPRLCPRLRFAAGLAVSRPWPVLRASSLASGQDLAGALG